MISFGHRKTAVLLAAFSVFATASTPVSAAVPSQQAVSQAAAALMREGCVVAAFPTQASPQVGVSCNNTALAALLNPYFSQSGFKIYSTGWGGQTKLDWRLGPQDIPSINFRQNPHSTAVIADGTLFKYTSNVSPLDIKVRVGDPISSGVESVAPIPGGLRFTIPFSRAKLLCHGDPAGPGGWMDNACPDVNWNSPAIQINLLFNNNLTLKSQSSVGVSGSFDLGGIDSLLPDRTMREIASTAATNALRTITPTANTYIAKFAKASVIAKYARMPENCIRLEYLNDNLRISIPVDSRNSSCARALGLPAI